MDHIHTGEKGGRGGGLKGQRDMGWRLRFASTDIIKRGRVRQTLSQISISANLLCLFFPCRMAGRSLRKVQSKQYCSAQGCLAAVTDNRQWRCISHADCVSHDRSRFTPAKCQTCSSSVRTLIEMETPDKTARKYMNLAHR